MNWTVRAHDGVSTKPKLVLDVRQGGADSNGAGTNTVDYYDTATGTLTTTGSTNALNYARIAPLASVVYGRILLAGGASNTQLEFSDEQPNFGVSPPPPPQLGWEFRVIRLLW